MDKTTRLLVINGSPRSNMYTQKALTAYSDHLKEEYSGKGTELLIDFVHLPTNLVGCVNCPVCSLDCNIKDSFQNVLEKVAIADLVMIGSPVYLDMPTAQTVALLTRLNCRAEATKREFFRGKQALLVAVGYCSGTKSVIHSLMGACEMLGFDIPARSTREYIILWKDGKLRGGRGAKGDMILLDI